MATRATYTICGMTFYCHWDGYPEGAAARFINMIDALTRAPGKDELRHTENRRGGLPFAFIRGNMDAEPTSKDAHGDTEWHYDVKQDATGKATITAQVRTYSGQWREKFTMDLVEFVNHYGRAWDLQRAIYYMGSETYRPQAIMVTADNARKIAECATARADGYKADNPNKAQCLNYAAAVLTALAALDKAAA